MRFKLLDQADESMPLVETKQKYFTIIVDMENGEARVASPAGNTQFDIEPGDKFTLSFE